MDSRIESRLAKRVDEQALAVVLLTATPRAIVVHTAALQPIYT